MTTSPEIRLLHLFEEMECEFPQFAALISQRDQHPQGIEFNRLTLEGTPVKLEKGLHYRYPDLKISCFGSFGDTVMKEVVMGYQNGITNIASDEELAPYVFSRFDHYSIPLGNLEQGQANPMNRQSASVHFARDIVCYDLTPPNTEIFVGSLSAIKDIDFLMQVAKEAQAKGVYTIGVIEVPLLLNNVKFDRERTVLLNRLQNVLDCLMLSSGFKPQIQNQDNGQYTLQTIYRAHKAIETLVDHTIASRNEYVGAGHNLESLQSLVLKGKPRFGYYELRDSAGLTGKLYQTIRSDFESSNFNNGLLLLYADESYSMQDIDTLVRPFFEKSGGKDGIASIWTTVPGNEGWLGVSVIHSNENLK